MATIWKHPNSPYWTAIYCDETGTWRKKTTKSKDRNRALAMSLEWERAADLGRDKHLTEARSREIISGILERTTGEKLRVESMREFCARWLKGKTDSKHEGTSTRYGATAARFLLFLGRKADFPLSSITPADCQKFYDHLASKKLAPASLIVEIKTLRTIFNSAFRQALISVNPALAVELPANNQQIERGTFSPQDIQIIYNEASPEWRTAILFGYYGAMRLADAVSRQWEEIDFANGSLIFTVGKTGRKLPLPLHPVLQKHLEGIAGDKGGPICPELAAVPVAGRSGLSKRFLAIMHKAGISNDSVHAGGQRMLSKRSFHALRVSFNSALHDKGVSQERRMKLTGHKTTKVNDRYTRSQIEPLRKEIKKLASIKL